MHPLQVGDIAPDFQAIDQDGQKISLSDFKGKKVILFFYPKANTPGCTKEACNLRDHYQELADLGFQIIGVSADSQISQKNFSAKYHFPYPLIPDTNKQIINLYGVWGEKSMYGKSYFGILRKTFIISEKGKIEKIYHQVETSRHAEQILQDVK